MSAVERPVFPPHFSCLLQTLLLSLPSLWVQCFIPTWRAEEKLGSIVFLWATEQHKTVGKSKDGLTTLPNEPNSSCI